MSVQLYFSLAFGKVLRKSHVILYSKTEYETNILPTVEDAVKQYRRHATQGHRQGGREQTSSRLEQKQQCKAGKITMKSQHKSE
eukprot:g40860.t1